MEHKISVKTYNDGIMSVNEFKNANLNKKEVAGIVLQTETIGLILALPIWKEKWGDEDICVDVKDEDDYIGESKALTTLCGLEATKRIIEATRIMKACLQRSVASSMSVLASSGISQAFTSWVC